MVIQLDITKVFAEGTYNRYMFVNYGGTVHCLRITNNFYWYLRDLGVPTSQALARKKCK